MSTPGVPLLGIETAWQREGQGRRLVFIPLVNLLAACLLRNDPILDLVVGRLRDDLLLHELILGTIRPPCYDLCRISIADSRECLQLLLARRIDVKQRATVRRLRLGLLRGWLGRRLRPRLTPPLTRPLRR